MYLTGIHAGIQAQHCTAAMFCDYVPKGNWEGDEDQENASLMLHTWASFRESDGALAGAYTSVGIILPERVYSPEVWESTVSGELKAGDNGKLSVFEQELARELLNCKLMT